MIAGEGAAGAGEAGLDFVGDHEGVALGAEGADVAQEAFGRDDDAALALDGFEQDGDGLVGHGRSQRVDVAVGDDEEAGGIGAVAVARKSGHR